MKLKVYLTIDGQEVLAKEGTVEYPWHFYICPQEGAFKIPDKGYVELGELEVTLPRKDSVIPTVLESLAELEQKARATFETAINTIRDRRSKLLSLTMEPAVEDIPANVIPDDWREIYTCICTGCTILYDDVYYWGDLWEDADNFLYNLAGAISDDAGANRDKLLTTDAAAVTCQGSLLLMPKETCTLSDNLATYISTDF